MTFDRSSDAQVLAEHAALVKQGVNPPHPQSPAGRRFASAWARQYGGFDPGVMLKAQLELGSSSDLHNRTAQEAIDRGDVGWHAVDVLTHQAGLMGGPTRLQRRPEPGVMGHGPTSDQMRPEYDPRSPHAYFEAVDQMRRAEAAREMEKIGADVTLAKMKLRERARRDPLIAKAVTKAERHAAKRNRAPTVKDFKRALKKLHKKHGMLVKSAGTVGMVPKVIDLRPGRFG